MSKVAMISRMAEELFTGRAEPCRVTSQPLNLIEKLVFIRKSVVFIVTQYSEPLLGFAGLTQPANCRFYVLLWRPSHGGLSENAWNPVF
jgi:hypothetical protein